MKIYKTKTRYLLLCLILITCITSCSKDNTSENNKNLETLSITDEILQLVNKHRASIEQPPLLVNILAKQLAEEHTAYMINEKEISHFNFNNRANILINEANAISVGENVAYKQQSAKAVMEAWLNSEDHRKNIEGDFTHIGIGVLKNSAGNNYFTQIFIKL